MLNEINDDHYLRVLNLADKKQLAVLSDKSDKALIKSTDVISSINRVDSERFVDGESEYGSFLGVDPEMSGNNQLKNRNIKMKVKINDQGDGVDEIKDLKNSLLS